VNFLPQVLVFGMQDRIHELPVVIILLVVVPLFIPGGFRRKAFFHKNPYIFPLVLSTVNLLFSPPNRQGALCFAMSVASKSCCRSRFFNG
jgi:hypothetical protein